VRSSRHSLFVAAAVAAVAIVCFGERECRVISSCLAMDGWMDGYSYGSYSMVLSTDVSDRR
jgi:hypothetical protein